MKTFFFRYMDDEAQQRIYYAAGESQEAASEIIKSHYPEFSLSECEEIDEIAGGACGWFAMDWNDAAFREMSKVRPHAQTYTTGTESLLVNVEWVSK